jgi:hypothetical protein
MELRREILGQSEKLLFKSDRKDQGSFFQGTFQPSSLNIR